MVAIPDADKGPPPAPKSDVPKYVDLAFAIFGAGASILLLDYLEELTGLQFYAPPLAASSIIIFSGIAPAPAVNVFGGTIGAAAFAVALHTFGGGSPETRAVAVAFSLAWFKLSGALFPPAAAMSAVFLDSPGLQERGWGYLLFPCLSGQAILYASATALAALRQRVRIAITKSQLDFSAETREGFEAMFRQFDTSGDGLIDATELQVALRAIIAADLDLKDCEELVRDADADGDGGIDFDEFMALLQFSPQVKGSLAAYEVSSQDQAP